MRQDEKTAALRGSFGAVAGEYDRLRSGPPPEALDWLLPPGATDALEIGAGTGLLTRLLAARVAHVTAVEPDDRMRAVLTASAPGVDVRPGHAEELPADSSSYDVVLAASAWHWVDEARAVPEVARVLRPARPPGAGVERPRPIRRLDALAVGRRHRVQPRGQADAVDQHRRRRHIVNVDAGGESPFDPPETQLFRWTRPMTRRGPRRALRHLQRRHHDGRRRPPATSWRRCGASSTPRSSSPDRT